MPDIRVILTALAAAVFQDQSRRNDPREAWLTDVLFSQDPVLDEAQREALLIPVLSSFHQTFDEIGRLAFSEPDLSVLAPKENELDVMVMHPGGGTRIPADGLVRGLLSSAILQMYFFRLQKDESTFVRTVLEGFEEVRRAAREKGIRAHSVTGIARVTLREGSQISTPWGVLGPAPPVRAHDVFPRYSLPRTTCTLAEPLDVLIKFDRAPSPMPFNAPESIATVSVLFPLSCALASKDSARPVVPLTTWWTLLVPFEGLSFGYSTPFPPFRMEAETDIADIGSDIEKWARMVHTAHAPSVDIAARRLVSAVASRSDTADSLVDAVMVWENLFGTRTEVNFRVTAALSKLLEADPAKRRSLRKELAKIYDIRSRVVHGERKLSSEIRGPCTRAIDVAVQALRACYERGRDWTDLSSEERADRILLEWQ